MDRSRPPQRWEVFDPNGKLIKPTIEERTAEQFSLAYTSLHAHTDAVADFIEESSAATDEALLGLPEQRPKADNETVVSPDDIRCDLLLVFRRICDVFAQADFREHMRITDADMEQLAARIEILFGEANNEGTDTRPAQTTRLTERCMELLRPLVTQILDPVESPALSSELAESLGAHVASSGATKAEPKRTQGMTPGASLPFSEADSQSSQEVCRLVGSVGTFAASLELMMTDHSGIAGELNIDGVLPEEAEVEGFLDDKGELTLRLVGVVASLIGSFDGRTFSGKLVTAEQDATSPFHFVAARSISGQTDDTESSSESRPTSLVIRSEPERTQVPVPAGVSSNKPPDDSRRGIPWLCPRCGRWMAKHVERCVCGLPQQSRHYESGSKSMKTTGISRTNPSRSTAPSPPRVIAPAKSIRMSETTSDVVARERREKMFRKIAGIVTSTLFTAFLCFGLYSALGLDEHPGSLVGIVVFTGVVIKFAYGMGIQASKDKDKATSGGGGT